MSPDQYARFRMYITSYWNPKIAKAPNKQAAVQYNKDRDTDLKTLQDMIKANPQPKDPLPLPGEGEPFKK